MLQIKIPMTLKSGGCHVITEGDVFDSERSSRDPNSVTIDSSIEHVRVLYGPLKHPEEISELRILKYMKSLQYKF